MRCCLESMIKVDISTQAGFSGMLLYIVRMLNQLEGKCAMVSVSPLTDTFFAVEANSLERIQSYIDIEKELAPSESGKPPASWPKSGDIRVENLTARYSPDGPIVLDNISFHIRSGERVGVG
jgi:ABC-type multidrug transport system fused ATPase/permease subunit